MLVLERHPGPPRINFSTNMTPTWLQLGPQMGHQKLLYCRFLGAQEGPGTPQCPNNSCIPVLNRFWTDLGPNLDRFGDDFERFLDRFLDDVSSICCLLYVVCCLLSVVCCLRLVVGCLLFIWCPLLLCYLLLVVFYCLLFAVCCLSCSFVFVRWLFVVSSLRDVHRTFAHSPGPAECAKRLE